MKALIIISTLFFSYFGIAQEETKESPVITIRIPIGETKVVEGVSITFSEVLEDSRCPTNVQCVWEGRVRAKVMVAEPGTDSIEKELIFGRTFGNEPTDKVLCKQTAFIIKGKGVIPSPDKLGEPLDYFLLIEKRTMRD